MTGTVEESPGRRSRTAARPLLEVLAYSIRFGDVVANDGVDLAQLTRQVWQDVDVLLLPTLPATFTVDEMLADPITRNSVLGRFTTFVNLLDLAALAVPAGHTDTGRPFGVTLVGPAAADALLAGVAVGLRRDVCRDWSGPPAPEHRSRSRSTGWISRRSARCSTRCPRRWRSAASPCPAETWSGASSASRTRSATPWT